MLDPFARACVVRRRVMQYMYYTHAVLHTHCITHTRAIVSALAHESAFFVVKFLRAQPPPQAPTPPPPRVSLGGSVVLRGKGIP